MLAVLLAGCSAAVLYSRVYLDFQTVRATLVQEQQVPTGGSVLVPIPDLSGLEGQATAIVIRLASRRAEPVRVTVLVDDNELGRIVVGPRRAGRFDLSVGEGPRWRGASIWSYGATATAGRSSTWR